MFNTIHHIAIIASDYQKSKEFYSKILGFEIVNETFRVERDSYKLDLRVNDTTQIELFSFPEPPNRTTNPEAVGLRHLAFAAPHIEEVRSYLLDNNVIAEPIRIDETTGKEFFFFRDPDDLPIEVYSG